MYSEYNAETQSYHVKRYKGPEPVCSVLFLDCVVMMWCVSQAVVDRVRAIDEADEGARCVQLVLSTMCAHTLTHAYTGDGRARGQLRRAAITLRKNRNPGGVCVVRNHL
jgi:hypothetical protein